MFDFYLVVKRYMILRTYKKTQQELGQAEQLRQEEVK